MCIGSSVSYVLLISFPFPALEDVLIHMWINCVSHTPFAIKNTSIFLQLQEHLNIEGLVGWHLFRQLSWKGGGKGEEK